MSIKAGSFAKFTDTDEYGKFSYVGRVLAIGKNAVISGGIDLEVQGEGIMHLPAADLEKVTIARKPRGFKSSGAVTVSKPKAKAKRAPRTKGGPTKRDLVDALVFDNPSLTRKEHIALVVEQIGMTPAGASTYVSGARKKLAAVSEDACVNSVVVGQ